MATRNVGFDRSGCAIVGTDHRICWVDSVLASLLGYSQAELAGRAFEEITHPPDRNLDSHLADRLFSGTLAVYQIEKRFIRKDQSLIRLNVHASVVRDVDGSPLYGIGIVRPVDGPTGGTEAATQTDQAKDGEEDRIRRAMFGS